MNTGKNHHCTGSTCDLTTNRNYTHFHMTVYVATNISEYNLCLQNMNSEGMLIMPSEFRYLLNVLLDNFIEVFIKNYITVSYFLVFWLLDFNITSFLCNPTCAI